MPHQEESDSVSVVSASSSHSWSVSAQDSGDPGVPPSEDLPLPHDQHAVPPRLEVDQAEDADDEDEPEEKGLFPLGVCPNVSHLPSNLQ